MDRRATSGAVTTTAARGGEVPGTILVMGATGNVGGEVVGALADGGQPVRAMSRTPGAVSWPAGVEPVAGDLNAPDSLDGALTGVGSVFMLAGYPDPPRLLARMKTAGVDRVVLLSTGAVVGGDLDNYVVRLRPWRPRRP